MCIGLGYIFANINVSKIFNAYLKALEDKDFDKADILLISCHIVSSTFKALSSWKAEQTERIFLTMTELATFQSTFIPKFFVDAVPSVTYEGDNTVLLQQTAKFILISEQ